jgi:HSP20 family protein
MLTRWDPFTDMNRLHNELLGRQTAGPVLGFRPSVDVYEDDSEILLQAELPGMRSEDVDVDVEDGMLTISGERKIDEERDKKGYHITERSFGRFTRSFKLPNTVDFEKIDAQMNNGLLEVHLPKRESSKPRKIAVKA